MFNLWFIYAIVSVADLILTGIYLNPNIEANPVASWIWSTFGFLGITLYKVAIVSSIYPMSIYIYNKSPITCKLILLFGILATSFACALFFIALN